jgi:rod shape determining protein RodA
MAAKAARQSGGNTKAFTGKIPFPDDNMTSRRPSRIQAVVPVNGPSRLLQGKFVRIPWGLILLFGLLGVVGVAALYAAAGGSLRPWASRHAAFLALGFAVMIGAASIPADIWSRSAYGIYGVAFGLLAAVELVGSSQGGAVRWLSVGLFIFQPLELMKIALVVALARYFAGSRYRRPALLPALLMTLLPAALALRQPALSGTILLAVGGFAVIFLAGIRKRWLVLTAVAAGVIAPLMWDLLYAYQMQRVFAFLNPNAEPMNAAWQTIQSREAFAAGGLLGAGDLSKLTYYKFSTLPLRQNDFVLSVVGERFGLLGSMTVLGLCFLVVLRCMAVCRRSDSCFGRLLSGGVGIFFGLHVAVHAAVTLGLLPVTGVPLPLISDGGTMTIAVLFGLGLLISVRVHGVREHRRRVEPRRRPRLVAAGMGLVWIVLAGRLVQLQMIPPG